MGTEVPVISGPQTAPDGSPEPDLSLAEHEAQFGGTSAPVDRGATETPPPTSPDDTHAEKTPQRTTDPRDDKGRFQRRTPRERRPESHQASPDDVPRIKELTARLREAEAERDRLRSAGPATVVGSPSIERAPEAPAQRPAPPTQRAKPTPSDTKADGSPKYLTYEDYLDDRDAWTKEQFRAELATEQRQREEASRVRNSWTSRVNGAREKHDDFDAVALGSPTRIPQGSIIDAWILEDEDGAEILYHLQRHETELTALLAQPPFQQVKTLSLLGQRLSTPRTQAAPTGAAARPPVTVPPRPPTPVRTVAQRATDEPPGDDASLAEHERVYGQRRRVR